MRALIDLPGTPLAQAAGVLGALVLATVAGLLLAEIVLRLAARIAKHTAWRWDDHLIAAMRGPLRCVTSLALLPLFVAVVDLDDRVAHGLFLVARGAFIASMTWLLLRLVGSLANMFEERTERRAQADGDVFGARGVQTQIAVLRRIFAATVLVVGAAMMLLQFDTVRSVGVSVLASAGVAGIVVGFAAQKTLGSLLGGLQLSITQPVRLGDSIILEKEFGIVEEVNLTYVVLKLWDQRRMVVPVQRLLEQPFQNWTRSETQLLGPVLLRLDFSAPLDAIRAKLDEILEGNAKWDGRVKAVQVTDASELTQEVRLLVSAKDASTLFDLRCEVREKVLAWLATVEGGRYLPRTRFDGRALEAGSSPLALHEEAALSGPRSAPRATQPRS
jgi:small-conductance mechanosensitive channel